MLEAHLLFVDLHLAEIATKCAEVFDVVGLEIYNFLFLQFVGGFFFSKCVDFHGGGYFSTPVLNRHLVVMVVMTMMSEHPVVNQLMVRVKAVKHPEKKILF